jgi:hypothetical protein
MYLKAKNHVHTREYKDATENLKVLDTQVCESFEPRINFPPNSSSKKMFSYVLVFTKKLRSHEFISKLSILEWRLYECLFNIRTGS